MKDVEQKIQQLVQSVVATVHPLRILLFGSAVQPENQEINDLDLLVVMPEGTHRRKTAQQLYLHLKGVGHSL